MGLWSLQILGFLPGGSDRQWRPWSGSPERKKSRSSCMRLSDCWETDPHTPHGSAAGSDAWSSKSSGKEKVGENKAVKKDSSFMFSYGGRQKPPSSLNSKSMCTLKTLTDMSVVIHQVVGELECVEGYSLLHPLGSTGRWVWVEVHPARGDNICSPCHQPRRAVECISDTHTLF